VYQNKYHATQIIAALQMRVFGQETAIHTVCYLLQNSYLRLQSIPGPLASFLFVGPDGCGKATLASVLGEYLATSSCALVRVHLTNTARTIDDLRIIVPAEDHYSPTLLLTIAEKPRAVVLLENIELYNQDVLYLFRDVLRLGYAMDATGNRYDFRNAIVILTTTVGADRLLRLQNKNFTHAPKPMDLTQLVLNDSINEPSPILQLSPSEIEAEISPALAARFPAEVLRHVTTVPFLPLDYNLYEKILRIELKNLVHQVDIEFNIDLQYTAEVLKFLTHEALSNRQGKSLDSVLTKHVCALIAHEIVSRHLSGDEQIERLILQLDDTGQSLRCETIMGVMSALE
jgi:type VI secretion system protein VasG